MFTGLMDEVGLRSGRFMSTLWFYYIILLFYYFKKSLAVKTHLLKLLTQSRTIYELIRQKVGFSMAIP